jgi:hypothetical protein
MIPLIAVVSLFGAVRIYPPAWLYVVLHVFQSVGFFTIMWLGTQSIGVCPDSA